MKKLKIPKGPFLIVTGKNGEEEVVRLGKSVYYVGRRCVGKREFVRARKRLIGR